MSSSSGAATINNHTNYKMKPSPTHHEVSDFAQNPKSNSGGKDRWFFQKYYPMKRISLPALLSDSTQASMTVEAAVLLPLFLFFLLNLGCAIELIRLHGNLQLALWETGDRLAVYGHALGDSDVASLFTHFYIRDQLTEYVGKEYLDNAPIKDGHNGLMFWESDIFSSEDELDVIVTYSVSPWSSLAGFPSFRMANRYYAHIWNGYGIPEGPRQGREEIDIVYITETGKVYHEDRNCTHLKLSIREVSRSEAEASTNQWGKSYTPCERCKPDPSCRILYVTDEGDRYHSDENCSGLKRTVFSVARSSVPGYRACSRCG